jgi:hypothetical protein
MLATAGKLRAKIESLLGVMQADDVEALFARSLIKRESED